MYSSTLSLDDSDVCNVKTTPEFPVFGEMLCFNVLTIKRTQPGVGHIFLLLFTSRTEPFMFNIMSFKCLWQQEIQNYPGGLL